MMSETRAFTWERGPFIKCPLCEADDAFGILSAGGDTLTRRCKKCRFDESERLPDLDKKVIYLDQFAVSELFKLKSGNRRQDSHTDFWTAADELITRALLLQQAIFPSSDVHQNETIVSAWPTELRHAYEGLGGDVQLEDTQRVELKQIRAFAEAFASGNAVHLDLGVDGILVRGKRNTWLRDMRIVLNTDCGQFADAIRASKAETGQQVTELMEQWRARGRSFDEVLEIEFGSYLSSRMEALAEHAKRYLAAAAGDDVMEQLNVDMSPIVREMATLRGIFEKAGVPQEKVDAEIKRFWEWPENRLQPFARIHAYLFAALAGQVKSGRKKPASPGFMNDVTVIASYAPYVDAMFVDNECATMLSQGRPRDELTYRARIFSLNSKDAFLEYLSEVAAGATEEVRRYAKTIYGA